jgi:hypothetical protein
MLELLGNLVQQQPFVGIHLYEDSTNCTANLDPLCHVF